MIIVIPVDIYTYMINLVTLRLVARDVRGGGIRRTGLARSRLATGVLALVDDDPACSFGRSITRSLPASSDSPPTLR